MSTDPSRRTLRTTTAEHDAPAVATTSPRTWWLLVAGAVLVAAAVVLTQPGPWSATPGGGGGGATDPDGVVTVDRGHVDAARLVLSGDADSVRIRTDAPAGDLVRVEPTGADTAVSVDADGAQPVVALGGGTVTVRLAGDVRWSLDLQVGAGEVEAGLAEVAVDGVVLSSGLQTLELSLPRPSGRVVVDQRAGAGSLVLHVPDGVGVHATVTSGAGSATVDGETTGGLGAGAEVATSGFDPDADHYEVTVGGGLGSLVVDRG
ncbi:hypothetical protein [Cellulomonas sp. URHB0016]